MDDIVLIGSSPELTHRELMVFFGKILVHNHGELSCFLGIQAQHMELGIHLSQQQFLVNLLASCDMENLKPSSTLMFPQQDLYTEDDPIPEVIEYH